MIRTFTAAEVSSVYRVPLGTVYRLASIDGWRRTVDGKWPVLYNGDDVEATMERRIDQLRAQIERLTAERNGYRDEVNQLRQVVGPAMAWRSTRRMLGESPGGAAEQMLAEAVDVFEGSSSWRLDT